MRTADYIFKYLAEQYGVSDVFMVTGGGAMFLNDAIGKNSRIRSICTHNEQGAAIAAEGYARVTGQLAVVCVTTGPGGTNALTGLIGEWLDSQPVLFISGQVKFSTTTSSQPELPLRQLGDQELNIVQVVKSITKYAEMVTDPKHIRRALDNAVSAALSGRHGPVWLDIPINVQSAEISENDLLSPAVDVSKQTAAQEDTEEIMRSLKDAKSPVIVAGHGIRLAGAAGDFLKLVEKWEIPVLGTFGGFDLLPTTSPFCGGRIGTIGTRDGNFILQNADWILFLGTRNNIRQVSYNYENYAKRAKVKIAVDIDPAELKKKTVSLTHAICADVGDVIAQLLKKEFIPAESHKKWLSWCQKCHRRYSVIPEYLYHSDNGINPYVFMKCLSEKLDEDSVICCTNATPSLALFQCATIKSGQRAFANSGCASMGFGLPAALGAAIAVKDKKQIICLEGDGSLMMNVQEMQTVAHHKLPIKMFLFNNNEYCSIRQTHDSFFAGRHTGCDNQSGVSFPDWEKLSAAFSWQYFRINSLDEAEADLKKILNCSGPVMIDVRLSPGYEFMPKLSSRRLEDGSIVSPSLEDMYPFLSQEELEENIYHP